MQIKKLWAEDWKSFGTKREVPLSRLTLLIGPNNAGKSNVLEILSFLRRFVANVHQEVNDNLSMERNVRSGAERARVGIDFVVESGAGTYSLALARGRAWKEEFASTESAFFATAPAGGGTTLQITHGSVRNVGIGVTSGLKYVVGSHLGDGGADELSDALLSYNVWRVRPEVLDNPSQVHRATQVGPSGESAAALLDHLRDRYPVSYEALQKDLCRCAPEIARVVAEASEQHGSKEIFFHEVSGAAVRSRFASEGLKFLLFVLLILHSPSKPRVMAFEEIEHGLHPRRIAELIGFLRELVNSPDGPQILFTSHSPLVLDQFRDTPEEVLVVERDAAGMTAVTPLPEILSKLKGKDGEKALGDLWFSGVLGGVPKT